jgi:hypothetical protein
MHLELFQQLISTDAIHQLQLRSILEIIEWVPLQLNTIGSDICSILSIATNRNI